MTPLEQLDADFARVKAWRSWKLSRILLQADTFSHFIEEEDFVVEWIGTEDMAEATRLHTINQVYALKKKNLTAKDTIEDSDNDDLDDDNDDNGDNAPKGPPKSRGKQTVHSSSSDKQLGQTLEKSRLETKGGGESSKAPQKLLVATIQQGTAMIDLNLEPHQDTIPEKPATSNEIKNQIQHEDEEDTPTLAEVFINERRATTKFISNAEVRLHKRLIKMKKHFDELLEMRFAEVHCHLKSNLMIQQVFNSEQKAQLNIHLSNQPAQMEALHNELEALKARDEELENQIVHSLKELREKELAVASQAAEPSAQVPPTISLPPNLEQALKTIQDHEEFIQNIKTKELPAMLKLSQTVVTKQIEHSNAIGQTRADMASNLNSLHQTTQKEFLQHGSDLQRLGQNLETTHQRLQNLENEVRDEVKTDILDINNHIKALSIQVYGLNPIRRTADDIDDDIEDLFDESYIPDAAKKGGNTTQAGTSSTKSLAAKKAAETRKKNKLYKEEAEIRKRKAEEAKAKEEAKKKQEDKQE
ncbi:unnamed protein product [Cuscuta europaea]|uniref:Uncharacterized protein n=1 Tax=Cuscuta europaea TaxID=41803 RepID=A0A9P1E5F2_CUSEU|nr:unnamed protein product [Cuscuta europaea]